MTSKIHKSLFIPIIVAALFLKLAPQIYASQCPTPEPGAVSVCEEYPFAFSGNRTLSTFITPFLQTAIVGAGVISFLLIVGAGFMMINSAGNKQAQEKGKNAITAGVMGLALVFGAYWIVQIILFLTGIDILGI